jgi:hypothetical protein
VAEERFTRREVLRKAAYITPVILTMPANLSFASAGSGEYTDGTKSIEYLGGGDEKDEKKKNHEKKDNTDYNDKKNWTNHSGFRFTTE